MSRKIFSVMMALVMTILLTMLTVPGCTSNAPDPNLGNTTENDSGSSGQTQDGKTDTGKNEVKVNIKTSETSRMEYDDYDNGMVSLQIPKGWQVDAPSVGYASYTFKVYDPQDENYMFLFCLKLSGFLKSEEARAAFASMYPSAVFGKLSAIDPQTTEAFYKVWNNNAKLANEEQITYNYFPYLNDFTVVENLGQLPLGGDVLRATFNNDAGELMQGLFTSSIFSSGTYMMYGYDFAPLSAYHTVMMMTPDAEFNNWQEIMDHCIGTIQFSNAFMQGFNREEETTVSIVQANQKIYDETSDMIMDSWEKRNNSYDIISQKRSDATLGYERVYDTETGEIYRAYNGFTDDYSGERYKNVTDDMYTSAISGYIEK